MRYKNQQEEHIKDSPSLQYKDHSEFFEEFFILRRNFNRDFSASLYDSKLLKACFTTLYQFREWSYSQTSTVNTKSDYDKRLADTMTYLKTGQNDKARTEMKTLFRDLSKDHQLAEMIPKIQMPKEDEIKTEKDAKVRNALRAYEIMYGHIVQ